MRIPDFVISLKEEMGIIRAKYPDVFFKRGYYYYYYYYYYYHRKRAYKKRLDMALIFKI
jgi:hypothetical protein